MKKIIYIVCTLAVAYVSAQNIMILSGNINRMIMKPSVITDSVEIDKAQLVVDYRFSKDDPTDTDNSNTGCNIRMLVGDKILMQKDLCLYYDHLIQTKRIPDILLTECRDAAGVRPSNLFSDIIFDLKEHIMTVRCCDYFHDNIVVSYTQPTPEFQWRIYDDEKKISGYKCKKATAQYGGKLWEVWFTVEIPVPFGPWKLNGLPGLILEASDNHFFSFSCIRIEKTDVPIMKLHFKSERPLKSKQDYFRYEKNSFEHPFQTFANGQQAIVATKGADGKTKYLDDSWTIPYNPIELE